MATLTVTVSGHELHKLAGNLIQAHAWGGWDHWLCVGRTATIPGLGKVTTVHAVDDYEYENYSTDNHVVVRVELESGDELLLRKDGTANSYGDRDWDGQIYEVSPIPKTVTVYERV